MNKSVFKNNMIFRATELIIATTILVYNDKIFSKGTKFHHQNQSIKIIFNSYF